MSRDRAKQPVLRGVEVKDFEEVGTAGPPPRSHHASFCYNGQVFIHGGESYASKKSNNSADTDVLADLWCFSPLSLSWSRCSTQGESPRLSRHSATVNGDSVLVFGGTDGIARREDVYLLDLASMTWSPVSAGIRGNSRRNRTTSKYTGCGSRSGHTATIIQEEGRKGILIIGRETGQGRKAPGESHVLWTNPYEWELHSSGAESRSGHCAFRLGSRVVIFGGRKDPCVDVLDLSSGSWSIFRYDADRAAPKGRAFFGSVALRSFRTIVAYGGTDFDRDCGDFIACTVPIGGGTPVWQSVKQKKNLPCRSGCSMTLVQDDTEAEGIAKAVIFGGEYSDKSAQVFMENCSVICNIWSFQVHFSTRVLPLPFWQNDMIRSGLSRFFFVCSFAYFRGIVLVALKSLSPFYRFVSLLRSRFSFAHSSVTHSPLSCLSLGSITISC